jgi:uncharacterized membrane protein YagU involved in acid resistance
MQNTANGRTLVGRRSLPDVAGLGGAVAGFLAGAIMVVLSPILSVLNGITIWEPPRLIAATVLGSSALDSTGFAVGPVLVGLVLHMITSVVLGFIFGLVLNRVLHLTTDFGLPIYAGLVYGMLIFFVAYFVILPLVNPEFANYSMGPLIAQNVVFGIFLGIFYMMVRPKPYTNTVEQD